MVSWKTVGSEDDFVNSVIADFGTSLTLYQWTETYDNDTGDIDLSDSTYDSGSTITALFIKKGQRFVLEKEGLLEQGDALLFVKGSQAIKKNDKIVYTENSQTYVYRVDSVVEIHDIYKRCVLYLWEK